MTDATAEYLTASDTAWLAELTESQAKLLLVAALERASPAYTGTHADPKMDVQTVSPPRDGSPIYSFRYYGSPRFQICDADHPGMTEAHVADLWQRVIRGEGH